MKPLPKSPATAHCSSALSSPPAVAHPPAVTQIAAYPTPLAHVSTWPTHPPTPHQIAARATAPDQRPSKAPPPPRLATAAVCASPATRVACPAACRPKSRFPQKPSLRGTGQSFHQPAPHACSGPNPQAARPQPERAPTPLRHGFSPRHAPPKSPMSSSYLPAKAGAPPRPKTQRAKGGTPAHCRSTRPALHSARPA